MYGEKPLERKFLNTSAPIAEGKINNQDNESN